MTAACHCPVLPDLTDVTAPELDAIVGGPLCCTSCGSELELRCPEGHVHEAPRTHSPNIRRPADAAPRLRTCGCGKEFIPRRWQRLCDDCTPKRGTSASRVYKPKLCTCGVTFTPTGPRAIRCPTCQGGR